jgi:hypothetical protein
MDAPNQDLERAGSGARTQCLFRDVNEGVRDLNAAFSRVVPLGDWICECFVPSCSDRIFLTLEEYEAVRASPARFAIRPHQAHFDPTIEDVVERSERYWIVEKNGVAAELAASISPRQRPSGLTS